MSDHRGVRWELPLLGFIVGLAVLSAICLAWQAAMPGPLRGAGVMIDRLSAALTFLVAAVGAVTFRFSQRYLEGEPGRRAFLVRLAVTVGAAYVLMLASNLLLLFAAWSLTSLGLHSLLTHYPDRHEAIPPARKKFLISRIGDIALVAAIALIGANWGTLDLATFLRAVGASGIEGGPALEAVGVLVAVAALTKSAQFPFHSWLPETMESPTPVSALMHAGVINAGGALVLRFAPVIVRVPAAMVLLTLVGTLTAVVGMLAMWSQVKVKRTLAWSTVGQMGFMMVQCGLAVFPAALLHILGHGLYKAWSFLRSGELSEPARRSAPVSPGRTLGLVGIGTILAVPALAVAAFLTGFSPRKSPGELAMAAFVALSIGQLWVAHLRVPARGEPMVWQVVTALGGTFVVALAAFGLYRGAEKFLSPVLGDLPLPHGPLAWATAIVPVTAMVALTVVHAILPVIGRRAAGRAFYVHALNGFYFGAVADGLVDRAWGRLARARRGVEGA